MSRTIYDLESVSIQSVVFEPADLDSRLVEMAASRAPQNVPINDVSNDALAQIINIYDYLDTNSPFVASRSKIFPLLVLIFTMRKC